VRCHFAFLQKFAQTRVSAAEMVDPNRRINQNHGRSAARAHSGAAPARDGSEFRGCSAKGRQCAGAFSRDQFFEAAMQQRGFLLNAGDAAGFIE
jgi:hypothetical protein